MIVIPDYCIIQGNMLEVLPRLPRATCVFADPPDNLGMKYNQYNDNLPPDKYLTFLEDCFVTCVNQTDITWLSVFYRYMPSIFSCAQKYFSPSMVRLIIWRYTFGQHRNQDLGNGFRPIFRIVKQQGKLYPNNIRIPSARQLKYNDKRANPGGRVPDDVWDFSRVCGTFRERRKWIPTQHPEALLERIILFSTQPGDLVIDPFLGSGTTLRVCQKIGRKCIGIDISPEYCQKISAETKVPILETREIER